jgi:hypothetical protein
MLFQRGEILLVGQIPLLIKGDKGGFLSESTIEGHEALDFRNPIIEIWPS